MSNKRRRKKMNLKEEEESLMAREAGSTLCWNSSPLNPTGRHSRFLKESLHIISMAISYYEIYRLSSLRDRLMVVKKFLKRIFLKEL